MKKKKAFTIIEILISMLILFTAVVFVNMTMKAYNNYQRKSKTYQNIYITTLSIKDWLTTQDMSKSTYKGEMNGIDYIAKITPLLQSKNYDETMFNRGNIGNFLITLYQINLTLITKTKKIEFSYLITKQKNLNPTTKESFF